MKARLRLGRRTADIPDWGGSPPGEAPMARILIVEDCPDACALVERALAEDHELTTAATLAEALERTARDGFDLALVDLALPDGDGFHLCSLLHNQPPTRDLPVIFLTASSRLDDKVTAFQLGADDYLEKPFHAVELRARVDARLRKVDDRARHEGTLELGDVTLDAPRFRAYVRRDDHREEIELTPHEFQLLHHLGSHCDEVMTRRTLLSAVWGRVVVSTRTIDTHMSNLRRKLQGTAIALESVRGVGYRLTVRSPRRGGRDFLTET
jgi:DNA-binding response OmpR family regulator